MNDVENYISGFEPEMKSRLNTIRQTFFEVVPGVEESMQYNMPAYKVGKHHLYFAAYKKHIGFYPMYGLPEIEHELSAFRAKVTKDTVHFPHNKPLPIDLIKTIIELKAKVQ